MSADKSLSVWMDVPGGLGWALTYDEAPVQAISVGDRTRADEDMVAIKFGWGWEEQRSQAFIDESVARAATMQFLRTTTRPTGVEWDSTD